MNRSRSAAAWITAAAVAGLIGACGGGAPSEIDVLVTPATLQITVDESALLRADVRGAGELEQAVTWSSGDAAVATVDAAGEVRASSGRTRLDGSSHSTASAPPAEPVQRPDVLRLSQ